MPQLLIEEVFIGGSVITAIQAADLAELREILRRLGTHEIDLRSQSQPMDRPSTIDALTQEDFDWLIHASVREPRMIVMPFRPDVAVDELLASQPPPAIADPKAQPAPPESTAPGNPARRYGRHECKEAQRPSPKRETGSFSASEIRRLGIRYSRFDAEHFSDG